MSAVEPVASQQAFGDAVNNGDLAALDDLVAANSVDHDPAPGQGPGPDGYRAFFADMRAAFPDMHLAVDTLVADGDLVAFAYTLTGTNDGPFQGRPATGKPISIRGMQISRIIDGKLVERWGSSDELGLLTQLGHLEAEQAAPDDAATVGSVAEPDTGASSEAAAEPDPGGSSESAVAEPPTVASSPAAVAEPAPATSSAAAAEPDAAAPSEAAAEPRTGVSSDAVDRSDTAVASDMLADHRPNGSVDPLAAAAADGPLPANADNFEVPANRESVSRHQDTGVIPIQDPDLDPEGVAQDSAGTSDADETITAINMRS